MKNTTVYTGTVIGPSYIYHYDNNSVTSLLDVHIEGNNHTTTFAIPEYLDRQIDIPIVPGYKVSFVVDVMAKVIDLDIVEMKGNTNSSFPLYPTNCPACNTPLTRVVYYRGSNKPYIARVCFSRSCPAFMTNNLLNMLRSLQLDIDYKYITSIIESALNKGIIADVSSFFRMLLTDLPTLLPGKNMSSELLYDCRDKIALKFKSDFKLIHVLQWLSVPLTEDIPLASSLCDQIPILTNDLALVDINQFMDVLGTYITSHPESNILNIASSILTFLQVHKNKFITTNLVSLIHAVSTDSICYK